MNFDTMYEKHFFTQNQILNFIRCFLKDFCVLKNKCHYRLPNINKPLIIEQTVWCQKQFFC